jgi:hypothetical protein
VTSASWRWGVSAEIVKTDNTRTQLIDMTYSRLHAQRKNNVAFNVSGEAVKERLINVTLFLADLDADLTQVSPAEVGDTWLGNL